MWLIFVPVCQVQASRGRESILGTVKDLGPGRSWVSCPKYLVGKTQVQGSLQSPGVHACGGERGTHVSHVVLLSTLFAYFYLFILKQGLMYSRLSSNDQNDCKLK